MERVYFELIGSQERSLSSVTDQHKRDTRVKLAALIDYLENMIWVLKCVLVLNLALFVKSKGPQYVTQTKPLKK